MSGVSVIFAFFVKLVLFIMSVICDKYYRTLYFLSCFGGTVWMKTWVI